MKIFILEVNLTKIDPVLSNIFAFSEFSEIEALTNSSYLNAHSIASYLSINFSSNYEINFSKLSEIKFERYIKNIINHKDKLLIIPDNLFFNSDNKDIITDLENLFISNLNCKISSSQLNSVERKESFVYLFDGASITEEASPQIETVEDLFAIKIPVVKSHFRFSDMSDTSILMASLLTNPNSRFFNSVIGDPESNLIIKKSENKVKLFNEYNYFKFLPTEFNRFHLTPFNYKDYGDYASYQLERLMLPNMASLYLCGAMSENSFREFLSVLNTYLSARPEKFNQNVNNYSQIEALLDKTKTRVAELEAHKGWQNSKIRQALDNNGISTSFLLKELEFALNRTADGTSNKMVLSHGDLCLSNILYYEPIKLLKFIDPKGASNIDEMYMDRYYDFAKLSHSILGEYDELLVQANFDIVIKDTGIELVKNSSNKQDLSIIYKKIFKEFLEQNSISVPLVRAYESSLFISMCSLHVDDLNRVGKFLLRANEILKSIK